MQESPLIPAPDAVDDRTHCSQLTVWGRETTPAIVREIASIADVPPDELPPLNEIMDPDGLETLLTSAEDALSVTFEYHDYLVTVSNEGDISVRAL